MQRKIKFDKQILSLPQKFNHVCEMFNKFRWYCNYHGNEIGWMWREGSDDQKMAYNYKWRYENWDRKSAWVQNWTRGQFVNEHYPYCIECQSSGEIYHYFGKEAALSVASLFEEALEIYKDFGQEYGSEECVKQNISWLEKNIKNFKNCAANEITAAQANYNRFKK